MISRDDRYALMMKGHVEDHDYVEGSRDDRGYNNDEIFFFVFLMKYFF